jgi:hypothetical protein
LRLARRIQTLGGHAQTIVYPDYGHRRVIGVLAAPLRGGEPVLDDIARFIEYHATRNIPTTGKLHDATAPNS